MPTGIALIEVDWCSPAADPSDYYPTLTRCDFCEATASDDFMAGKDVRRFLRQSGGVNDSLVVCEHCLDEYLAEPMT